jgi:hypothetical protein
MPFSNLAAQSAQSRPATVKLLVRVVAAITVFVSACGSSSLPLQQSQATGARVVAAVPSGQQSQAGSGGVICAGCSLGQQLQLVSAASTGFAGGQQLQVAAGSGLADCSEAGEQQLLWQAVFLGRIFPDIFLKFILVHFLSMFNMFYTWIQPIGPFPHLLR